MPEETSIVLKMMEFILNMMNLCLKNVHLVVAWLPIFEKELNSLLTTGIL